MFDLVIIGGSAAGASAAIYASRRKLNFVLISQDFGGEVARSGDVLNYPGFIETNGIELADAFLAHVKANNVEPTLGVTVEAVTKRPDGIFEIRTVHNGAPETLQAKTVIIATGVHPRHLNIPNESELAGKGVTYCTTCDGPLYKGKKVVTIGGGNSALESALMLAEIASHVTLININGKLNGEQVLIDKVLAHKNIEVIFNAETTKINGEPVVQEVVYRDTATGDEHTVPTQGVFIHIGMIPNSGIVPPEVTKNAFGEIEVNLRAETAVPGLLAAGDVTAVPYKQIAIATGQGVTAALSVIDYLNRSA